MICFDIFFSALNVWAFFVNQNGNIYIRGFNLAACIILGLLAIGEMIKQKKISIKNIQESNNSSEIKIEKHGSYYYTETCPVCSCVFHFDPHSLGFSYDNVGEENETRTEWIYCPECAHKFEWNEGYHKKLNC